MTSQYAIVGYTPDPPGPCQECGTAIKKGVWIVPVDPDGNRIDDPTCVGSDCASRMIGYFHEPGKPRKKATKRAVEKQAEAVQHRIEERWKALQQRMASTIGEANQLYQITKAPIEGSEAYQLQEWIIRIHPERFPLDKMLVEQAGFVPYQRPLAGEQANNPPRTITPGGDWAQRTVDKLGDEIEGFGENAIISEGQHGPYTIRILDAETTIFWGAYHQGSLIGAGVFNQGYPNWQEGTQAVLPAHQRKGIYSAVLQWMRDYAEPATVESDGEQSAPMQAAWAKAGAEDRGDYFELPNPPTTAFAYEVAGDTDNTGSISATYNDDEYRVVEGIRSIPMSEVNSSWKANFYSASDRKRVDALKEKLQQSRTVSPLIVVHDAEGYYILEGSHRLVALGELGAQDFPAMLVITNDSSLWEAQETNPRTPQTTENTLLQGSKPTKASAVVKAMVEQDMGSGRFNRPKSKITAEWKKRIKDTDYMLMWFPINLLDYQDESSSSKQRINRAKRYAEIDEDYPPILISYGPKAAKLKEKLMFVRNGNHRVLAAAISGDDLIQAYVPFKDFNRWANANDIDDAEIQSL